MMFWLILFVGIYILGVIVARNVASKYVSWLSIGDVIGCFCPAVHWIYAFIIWAEENEDDFVDRFFKKRN